MKHSKYWVGKAPGAAPGSLVYTGEADRGHVRIEALDYGPDQLEVYEDIDISACQPFKTSPSVTWINVIGIHDVEVVETLGGVFGIHPLALEDILNPGQRPKIEEYDHFLFIIVKMLQTTGEGKPIESEQVALIVGEHFVLSFQEKSGDVFDPVRRRLQTGGGNLRKMGPDYLAYALIDTVVDHYFSLLDELGERIEALETAMMDRPPDNALRRINHFKRQVMLLRRAAWPQRECLAAMMKLDSPLLTKKTKLFLRDAYDHALQAVEFADGAADTLGNLTDLHLNHLNQRMNEIMRFLTIVGTIFIPLTFIAGLYGMNFQHMPELGWKWGYPGVLGFMALVGIGLAIFFRKRKWL